MKAKNKQSLNILYFARLSEQLNQREETLVLPDQITTVAQLREFLSARGVTWIALSDANIRMAVNQEIAKPDTPVNAGDEVAFFPPVTGG